MPFGVDDFFGAGGTFPALGSLPEMPPGITSSLPDLAAPVAESLGTLPSLGTMPDLQTPDTPGWGTTLTSLAKSSLPWLQAGVSGAGIYSGIRGAHAAGKQAGTLERAEKFGERAAAPAVTAAEQLYPAATTAELTGTLPPELESEVQGWARNRRAAVRAFYAHAGIADSTMMEEADAQIDIDANSLRAQLAGKLMTAAQGATTAATAPAAETGRLATTQYATLGSAEQQAMDELNRLIAAAGTPSA